MTILRLAALALLLTVLSACTSGGGGPAAFDYSGQWTGTIQDSIAGTGTVSASLAQSGNQLGGTWSATFNAGNNGGSLTGVITGNSVVIELYPSNPSLCPYRVVANRSGSSLTGDYSAFNCSGTITGTLSIHK